MATRRNPNVGIVGPGRLGQAMGKLLHDAGVPIAFVAARKVERARNAAWFIGGGKALSLRDRQLAEAEVVLITASDSALIPVARRLAGYRKEWSGRVVLHACGSAPASVLEPFKKRGASIGSIHPYQTVPNPSAGVRNLPGGFWGVEGDRKAVGVARKWVKLLAGQAFEVPPELKPLYHLSAFLVCPTVVTLMDCSQRLLRQAGVPKRVIRPMLGRFVAETVNNFVELGGRRSLTGPAVRGDWTTLERHIAQLQRFAPEMIPAYVELVDLMLLAAGSDSARGERAAKAPSRGGRTRAANSRRGKRK